MAHLQHIRWSERGKPVGDEARAADGASTSAGPGATLRKVLVVDDEPDLADITAMMLGYHGLDVLVAYSGRQALAALQNDPDIDAVFSDIVMPGMTGVQLAEAVRAMYPAVMIVLASGYALPALLEDARTYLYTAKPYTIETVLKLLRT